MERKKINLTGNILAVFCILGGFEWRMSWILAILIYGFLAIYNHTENKNQKPNFPELNSSEKPTN